jgi:hypothetical protein
MEEFTESGTVLREGVPICDGAEVTRRAEARATRVPVPGSPTIQYKDQSVRGETTIRIIDPDPGFREELEKLRAIASDVDLARANRGWAPAPVTVEIGSRTYADCRIGRPLDYFGGVEALEYRLEHGDL